MTLWVFSFCKSVWRGAHVERTWITRGERTLKFYGLMGASRELD